MSSYPITASLFLASVLLSTKPATTVKPPPTNHIVVIDCSGSMYGELPKIREQLKKKLPKLLGDQDTISIVWFSGRGQFGTLLEAEPVATLADLSAVNQAIDRWLKPVCLTGFKEPLEEAAKLVDRIGKKRPGTAFSLFFMSDGCDNQWSRAEILKAIEKAAGGLAATTIVEYGYYADRPLLAAMAEKAGGAHIFAEHFDTYQPAFEAAMQRKIAGVKKVEVNIKGDVIGGFAFAMAGDDLLTFTVEDGKILVPESVSEVLYLTPTETSGKMADPIPALYAAISLFSVRMKPEVVLPLLKATGDVSFIKEFGGCFGKQRYSAFMERAKAAAFDPKGRLTLGFDPSQVPPDDAFTVLQLLEILADDDACLLLDHPEFKYNRISRARVDASENLSAEEQEKVNKLTEEMGKTKDVKKIASLAQEIAAITSSKQDALKFVEDKGDGSGYAISNLTYNEEKPNISVLVRKTGTVDISGRVKDGEFPKLPRSFPTFIFRNYAIVKDGLVNVKALPVRVTPATIKKLRDAGMSPTCAHTPKGETLDQSWYTDPSKPVDLVFDLTEMPIINRNMVKACSAKALFEKEYALTKARAAQKVLNAVKKERFPRTSEGYEVLYGVDAAAWLKEQGFTDYSGFSPKQVQAEATDVYMAKELKLAIKGLSAIPSMNEFKKQAAKGKLNAGAALMKPIIEKVEGFLASDVYVNAANQDKLFEAWIDGEVKAATTEVRKLISEMAKIKFAIIVGQIWFTEFATLDENTLDITADGQKLTCTATLREVEVKI